MSIPDPTLRISAYWNDRRKGWDLVASGMGTSTPFTVTHRVDGTAELDRAAAVLLLECVSLAIESWLF
jgi:hypothetical protein